MGRVVTDVFTNRPEVTIKKKSNEIFCRLSVISPVSGK